MEDREFRTVRGYEISGELQGISPAMEDYLEMAARLSVEGGQIRIGRLSAALQVKPSSASKMVHRLKAAGYLYTKEDGGIYLTELGEKLSCYLLYRHETIENFLRAIGSENPLRETELIEHYLLPGTVDAIGSLTEELK